jgi:hypothetical protein
MKIRLALLASLVPVGSLLAHHSISSFDTTKAVRVKGTIVQFHRINPHSFIVLEQSGAEQRTTRWSVEGPSALQLDRRGISNDVLKPGNVVEVCGYLPKENTIWQIVNPNSAAASLAGRLINAELLVMPDGREESWGDYGVHLCFAPGHRDQHSK